MKFQRESGLPYPQPWEWIRDNIFLNKFNGFFVDVGANDGQTVSNTAFFELEYNWKGICIEPHPEAFCRLEKNRQCIKYNCCISDEETILDFLSVTGYAEMLSGIKSNYDTQHLDRINNEIKKHGGKYSVIKIKSNPLRKIFKENNVNTIDYLSIDTEGSEFQVLKSINFDEILIDVISIENNYKDDECINFLKNKNYKRIASICGDDIFTRIDL